MTSHHLHIKNDDAVLIDLGGWGLLVHLDKHGEWYDVEYVRISKEGGEPSVELVPADMVVYRKSQTLIPQARQVRIWRHKAK